MSFVGILIWLPNGLSTLGLLLSKGLFVCTLICLSMFQALSIAAAATPETFVVPPTTESRSEVSKRSWFIFGMCVLVFLLLNIICCAVSIPKAIRDRRAIIYRNLVRRKEKQFADKSHHQLLLGDQHRILQPEPKLTSVVNQAIALNASQNPYAEYHPRGTCDPDTRFEPSGSYLQPQDTVTHHFSRSPRLLRATINSDIYDNDLATTASGDSQNRISGTYSHLSAYPRSSHPPLASVGNI